MSIALKSGALFALAFVAAYHGEAPPLQAADPVADFYKGKQMRMIIRSEPGGGYDLYGRLIAVHMVKHIPGNPTMIPVNMPGAGGIRAANYVAKVAPQDGTILSILTAGMPMFQALGLGEQFDTDLRQLAWIGNMSSSNQVTYTWHTSPTKTLEQAKQREAILGVTGAGSITMQLPALYNNMLGTKFRIIPGYDSSSKVALAMERGEIDGSGSTQFDSLRSTRGQWIAEKKINFVIQTGLKREDDLPTVPTLLEQASNDEQRRIFTFMSQAVSIGRLLHSTPGVPPERVAALRNAFTAMLNDPDFKRDAEKQKAEYSPMPGDQVETIIRDLLGVPPALAETIKTNLEPKDGAAR